MRRAATALVERRGAQRAAGVDRRDVRDDRCATRCEPETSRLEIDDAGESWVARGQAGHRRRT